MALTNKITCNGIKPSKSEVYTLAAELTITEDIVGFKAAIISALKSYDYYYYDYYDYDDNDYHYHYDYHYYHHYDYDYYYNDYYDYYDYDLTKDQKVIALLFLAAMHA